MSPTSPFPTVLASVRLETSSTVLDNVCLVSVAAQPATRQLVAKLAEFPSFSKGTAVFPDADPASIRTDLSALPALQAALAAQDLTSV